MNELFSKYYYDEDNIKNKKQLWDDIKQDKNYNKNIRRVDFDKWLAEQDEYQQEKNNI